MIETIKELEAKLAQAKAEEAKMTGFDVVIFEGEELVEIKAKAHELSEQDKATIMRAAGTLGDNMESIQRVAKQLDNKVGAWLEMLALIDVPLKSIISIVFGIEAEKVASLPNIELLGLVFEENQWINTNAKNLAKELEYIAKKQ
ncbi:hypothetical protein [Enterococcus gallinarum]|uniref:hypothetical protein n=1 Tax=Enterococcus gallinarum TaxID=1353 RepID=UPI0028909487|nr:hypothetical protein [Enterococcus gallinarum]MDT2685804.1 hypothetical protein [Enterococcus gallinarum]